METNPEAKAFTLDIVKELKANADAWGMNMVIISVSIQLQVKV